MDMVRDVEVWGKLCNGGEKIKFVCPTCGEEIETDEYVILQDQVVKTQCPNCGNEFEIHIECPENCAECIFNCEIECSIPCEECVRFELCKQQNLVTQCKKCGEWYPSVAEHDCE